MSTDHDTVTSKCPKCGEYRHEGIELPPHVCRAFVKADQAKARMDLLPPKVLEGVAQVLAFGAKKYAAWNWVKAPAYGRYFAAAQRHLAAWQAGEDLDPETGLPHLHHALCSLMFLAELQRLGEAQDDRPTDARLRTEIGLSAPRCARRRRGVRIRHRRGR